LIDYVDCGCDGWDFLYSGIGPPSPSIDTYTQEEGEEEEGKEAEGTLPSTITQTQQQPKPPGAALSPLARPFSRPNLALTVGNLVYGLVSTFFRVPIG
jgi:hypothetical protein